VGETLREKVSNKLNRNKLQTQEGELTERKQFRDISSNKGGKGGGGKEESGQ